WDPLILVLSSQPTTCVVQELLDRLGARGGRRRPLLGKIGLDVPPTDVPPTDVPPTDVPPTDVPPTDVPPTDVPPTDVPPTPVPEEEVPTTTHKNRADWFGERFSYPAREADMTHRLSTLIEKPAQVPAGRWYSIGPSNFAGRITSLVCDPHDPRIIFAG